MTGVGFIYRKVGEELEVLVNIVDSNREGKGPYHNMLSRTEYASVLKDRQIRIYPHLFLHKEVMTIVFKRKLWFKLSRNYLKFIMFELCRKCKELGITSVLLPLHILVLEGFSVPYLKMIITVIFEDTGIKCTFV